MPDILSWVDTNKGWLLSGSGLIGLWRLVLRWRASRKAMWPGVTVGKRYYAWDGPALHTLPLRPGIPASREVIEAIKKAGVSVSFGLQSEMTRNNALGRLQVFETDRKSWRAPLLYVSDPDQVLLAEPT